MIKNFKEFLNESVSSDLDVINFVNSVTRAFNNDVYLGHFIVDTETRYWKEDLSTRAELKKPITEPAKYILNFKFNEKRCKLKCSFDISYFGQTEMDVPDDSYTGEERDRIGVVLDELHIKKLEITSDEFNYDSSNIPERLKEAVISLMIKVMHHEYDLLSPKLTSLQQSIHHE